MATTTATMNATAVAAFAVPARLFLLFSELLMKDSSMVAVVAERRERERERDVIVVLFVARADIVSYCFDTCLRYLSSILLNCEKNNWLFLWPNFCIRCVV
jgi:hypothetical protein